MLMEKIKIVFTIITLTSLLSHLLPFSAAAEDTTADIEFLGLELDKIIILLTAWLATFLFVVTFIAYKRDGRKRLLYVSLAFLLFAIKSFLVSSELFIPEIKWIEPISTVLEFAALLVFFYGVLKK